MPIAHKRIKLKRLLQDRYEGEVTTGEEQEKVESKKSLHASTDVPAEVASGQSRRSLSRSPRPAALSTHQVALSSERMEISTPDTPGNVFLNSPLHLSPVFLSPSIPFSPALQSPRRSVFQFPAPDTYTLPTPYQSRPSPLTTQPEMDPQRHLEGHYSESDKDDGYRSRLEKYDPQKRSASFPSPTLTSIVPTVLPSFDSIASIGGLTPSLVPSPKQHISPTPSDASSTSTVSMVMGDVKEQSTPPDKPEEVTIKRDLPSMLSLPSWTYPGQPLQVSPTRTMSSSPLSYGAKSSSSPKAELSKPFGSYDRPSLAQHDAGGVTTYACPVCGQSFPSYNYLANHMVNHLPSETVSRGESKVHMCKVCNRSFSRSDMLTRHLRLHTGIKPYDCHICGQVFSRSDHLHTHLRTHTGEKPYRCPQCPYAAPRRDMITRHLRIHMKQWSRVGRRGSSTGSSSSVEARKSSLSSLESEEASQGRRSLSSSDSVGYHYERHQDWAVTSCDSMDSVESPATSQSKPWSWSSSATDTSGGEVNVSTFRAKSSPAISQPSADGGGSSSRRATSELQGHAKDERKRLEESCKSKTLEASCEASQDKDEVALQCTGQGGTPMVYATEVAMSSTPADVAASMETILKMEAEGSLQESTSSLQVSQTNWPSQLSSIDDTPSTTV